MDENVSELDITLNTTEKGRFSGFKVSQTLGYEKLGKILGRLPHLKILNISRLYPTYSQEYETPPSDFVTIPLELFGLVKLEELNFYDCQDSNLRTFFETVPSNIKHLSNLKKLTISRSGLISFDPETNFDHAPYSIFNHLTGLECLSVPGNSITKIPDALSLCKNLKQLRVYNNKITQLPGSLLSLKKLVELNINGNNLWRFFLSLPNYCPDINSLKILNQNHSKRTQFISSDDKQLLKLRDQEQNAPKDKPYTSTCEYVKNFLEKTERVRMNRCKIMFLGDGAVGKTTTINNLKKYAENSKAKPEILKDNVATDGIHSHILRVPAGLKHCPGQIGGSECINFLCLDFAGQDVYSYTHQFFLTEKAVYLIGVNIEEIVKNQNTSKSLLALDYWIQSVSVRCPNSPIIIFGTHIDGKITRDQIRNVSKKITDRYVKSKELNVVSLKLISNITGRGVKDLLDDIKNVCKSKKYVSVLAVNREYPLSWLLLEEYSQYLASSKAVPFVSFKSWSDAAINFCGIHENEVRKASQFLNDIGCISWFQEDKLSDVVCVRPSFLANVFSAVVSAKTGLSTGILNHDLLIQLWRGFPVSLHAHMIALLENFEIIHRLEGEAINNVQISKNLITDTPPPSIENIFVDNSLYKGKSIVPSLLPNELPHESILNSVWPEELPPGISQVERVFKFNFVPNGFFSRLMVRVLHTMWKAEAFWRDGIIVSKGSCTVFLLYNRDEKEISLKIRDVMGENRLGPLIDSLNTLISDWLKHTEMKSFIPLVLPDGMKTIVDISTVEAAVMEGSNYLTISNYEIRIDEVTPDLVVVALSTDEVLENEFTVIDMIGEGGFATVYMGMYNNEQVAIKKLKSTASSDTSLSEVFAEFRREVWLMKNTVHRNLVTLKGVCMKPNLTMILELMDQDLYTYIVENHPLSYKEVLSLSMDVARGIQFLHNKQPPIVHRDLKSPNILLKYTTGSKYPIAKIADFGLSRGLIWSNKLEDKAVDNPIWLAPEIITKSAYTEKVDIYALGVIFYELVIGRSPFSEYSFLYLIEEKIIKGERSDISTIEHRQYADLIEICWAQDPKNRPSINEVVENLESQMKQVEKAVI